MKESEVKLLTTHGALKDVVIERSDLGARSTSDVKGWLVKINGEALASARRPVRIFASLDTAALALKTLGIEFFAVQLDGLELPAAPEAQTPEGPPAE